MAGPAGMILGERRRRGAVAAPPLADGVGTKLPRELLLVQTRRGAVVPLVELPRARHRYPKSPQLLEHEVQRLDRALQHAGEGDVEGQPVGAEEAPRGNGVALAGGGERNVHPTCEAILCVPDTLAMAHNDERDSFCLGFAST